MIVDVELEPDLTGLTWVCHGCHRRFDEETVCCPDQPVLLHDVTQPCEDCALPEIVEE